MPAPTANKGDNGGTRPRGRPRGSNARNLVLTNAEQAFALHGYHACTVEHLLEAAGVSRRSFYRSFRNKEEVFREIFSARTDALSLLVRQFDTAAVDAEDAQHKLAQMFEIYLRGNFSVGPLLPVLIQESMAVPEYREIRERLLEQFKQAIVTILSGAGSPPPNDLLLEGCLAAIERIVLVQSRNPGDNEAKIETIKETCLQFVPVLLGTDGLTSH